MAQALVIEPDSAFKGDTIRIRGAMENESLEILWEHSPIEQIVADAKGSAEWTIKGSLPSGRYFVRRADASQKEFRVILDRSHAHWIVQPITELPPSSAKGFPILIRVRATDAGKPVANADCRAFFGGSDFACAYGGNGEYLIQGSAAHRIPNGLHKMAIVTGGTVENKGGEWIGNVRLEPAVPIVEIKKPVFAIRADDPTLELEIEARYPDRSPYAGTLSVSFSQAPEGTETEFLIRSDNGSFKRAFGKNGLSGELLELRLDLDDGFGNRFNKTLLLARELPPWEQKLGPFSLLFFGFFIAIGLAMIVDGGWRFVRIFRLRTKIRGLRARKKELEEEFLLKKTLDEKTFQTLMLENTRQATDAKLQWKKYAATEWKDD